MDCSDTKLYHAEYIPAARIGFYSEWIQRYCRADAQLRELYAYEVSVEGVSRFIRESCFSQLRREQLVLALQRQYTGIDLPEAAAAHLHALRQANTFVVATGQQPVLMGGPLLVAYKILSAVRLCQYLNEQLPAYRFVPIFWMAAEDHDWQEIGHFHLYGRRYEWHTSYAGAAGRYELSDAQTWIEMLPEAMQAWAAVYQQSRSWAEAHRRLLNELFGPLGVLVIDGDDPLLKAQMKAIWLEELLRAPSQQCVEQANVRIQALGGQPQAYVRAINLFYLTEHERLRVEQGANGWQTVDGTHTWTAQTLAQSVEQSPESWSPNVFLRPVYQQACLPAAVYIGGAAEVNYWLQLKPLFEYWRQRDVHIQYPVVSLRQSAFVLTAHNVHKLQKLGLSPMDLLSQQHEHELINRWINQQQYDTDAFNEAKQQLASAYERLAVAFLEVDASLVGKTKASQAHALKQIEELEKRFVRAIKQREQIAVRQLQALHQHLFPEGIPQERYDSLFTFFLAKPSDYWHQLLAYFEPFAKHILLLIEE